MALPRHGADGCAHASRDSVTRNCAPPDGSLPSTRISPSWRYPNTLSWPIPPTCRPERPRPWAGVLGYLLKDRIAGLEEMTDALERIQTGGVVLDPEVDSTAFSKPRAYPLAALMLRELVVLCLMVGAARTQESHRPCFVLRVPRRRTFP